MARKHSSRNNLFPADLNEANAVLRRIGEIESMITRVEALYKERIDELRRLADEELEPLTAQLAEKQAMLQTFAEAKRTEILVGDGKTVTLGAGKFGWRMTPTKVTTGRGGDAKVLQSLIDSSDMRYVRVVHQLDKESMLRDRPVIAGVKYTQKESFFIEAEPVLNGSAYVVTLNAA